MSSGSAQEISLRSFQYEELEQATNGFKEEVGRGAFGTVFKGTLPNNNQTIAVKKINRLPTQDLQGSVGACTHPHHLRPPQYCQCTNPQLVTILSHGSSVYINNHHGDPNIQTWLVMGLWYLWKRRKRMVLSNIEEHFLSTLALTHDRYNEWMEYKGRTRKIARLYSSFFLGSLLDSWLSSACLD
ncbi:hypothetical protein Scep_030260 [Stephania cephalantha]|uniref:Protein kinase domain-containing protein n=1 Tax=Stephania cephalantha TaxID=152367 RepID=A0AAP0HE71_9MAGN